MLARLQWSVAATMAFVACGDGGEPMSGARLRFVDGTALSPDLAVFQSSESWQHVAKFAPGVGLGDLDGDGHIDLVQSLASDTSPASRGVRIHAGDGTGGFRDVTGIDGTEGHNTTAVVLVDYDGDDDLDVLVGADSEPVMLLRNDGNFRFTDVAAGAGLARSARVFAAAAGDVDGDRDVDLYLGVWNASAEEHGPGSAPNLLYLNDGSGYFTEVGAQRGARCGGHSTLGTVMTDVDNDRDLDIYVTNDYWPDCLLINDGSGRFADVAAEVGVAGGAIHGMGVGVGDVDGDGFLDIMVTDDMAFDDVPGNPLWLNGGDGTFREGGAELGIDGYSSFGYDWNVSWGVGLVDFDLDGDLDVHVATHGDRQHMVWQQSTQGFEAMDMRDALGHDDCRGTAYADLDGDGAIDIVAARRGGLPPQVIFGDTPAGNGLRVVVSPRSAAPGAHVVVTVGDRQTRHEIHAGDSYMSSGDSTVTVGLGTAERAERVEVSLVGHGEPLVFTEVPSGVLKVTVTP